MNKGIVKVYFTKGFGNNLFQYCFAKILAEKNLMKMNHPPIPELGILEKNNKFTKNLKLKKIKITSKRKHLYDSDCKKYLKKNLSKYNVYLFGYFEDYTIYKPYLKEIRSWFPNIKKTNTKDLVLHLRLRNRLVQENHFKNFVPPENYKHAIEEFNFERLYIVSDEPKWESVDEDYITSLRKKYPPTTNGYVPIKDSVDYMNNLVEAFKEYNPILKHNNNFIDDFNFIRSFDKILLNNSTFSWWAAVLSHASKIGVFRPWKKNKGKIRNKNLGETDYPGWFSWE